MLEVALELGDIVNVSAPMVAGSKDAALGRSATDTSFLQRFERICENAQYHARWPVLQCLSFETRVTQDAVRTQRPICPRALG